MRRYSSFCRSRLGEFTQHSNKSVVVQYRLQKSGVEIDSALF